MTTDIRSRQRARAGLAVAAAGLLSLISPVTGASASASANTKSTRSYVALGDSYTSGDGTANYYPSSGRCLRSPDAYPELVAARLHLSLKFPACAGATTTTLLNSQLGSLNKQTAFVSIGIGGNDTGLSSLIGPCLEGTAVQCESALTATNAYITASLPKVLSKTYTKIRQRAPKARIVVLGYPRPFSAAGAMCSTNPVPVALQLQLNQATDELDVTIAAQAKAHHFRYVDPRAAFDTHEICSTDPYLNGYIGSTGSFHPTVAGQLAFAKLVEPAL